MINKLKFFIIPIAIYSTFYVMDRLVIVETPSINKTLFLKYSKHQEFERGDYAVYLLNDDLVGNVKITKKIACVGGDKIKVVGTKFYCNDNFLGIIKEKTSSGLALTPFLDDGEIEIPEGFVFLMGDSKNSYDSRYFGLVDSKELQKVFPLI